MYTYFFFLSLEPHAPPQNVRENSTTSTSIFVKWDDVPSEDQNGIIISYTVRYRAVSAEGPFNTTTVMRKEANLTGLIKDEFYNVSVLATTVKGDGPYSYPKIFVTNENSEYYKTFIRNSEINTVVDLFVCLFCFFLEHEPFDNGKYLKNQLRRPLDRQL